MKFKLTGILGEDGKVHPVKDGDEWVLDIDEYGPLMVKEKSTTENPETEFVKYIEWFGFEGEKK